MGNNNKKILQSNDNNEINNLKNELTKANKIIEQQKMIINELQNKLNNYDNIINNLNNDINKYQIIISQKDLELYNIKSQLNDNIPNNKYNFNDILCVNFISSESKCSFCCNMFKSKYYC